MPQLTVKDANNNNQTIGYYANTGQAVSSASIPVVIASDQPAITVSISSSQISALATEVLQKDDGTLVNAKATESGSASVGNFLQKFRDGFVTAQPDLSVWNQAWANQGTGFVNAGGNSSGSAYLRVSMCPLTPGMEYTIWTKRAFDFPYRQGYGLSMSQRIVGQEVEVSAVGVDGAGAVEVITPSQEKFLAISGTISITSNVATVNFASAHGFNGGDRVILVGNTDPRLNVGPVVVTVVTATQITVPCTLANGTYTAGGNVKSADPVVFARNALGMVYENATATNASFAARRNGAKFRTLNSTVSTTVATQANVNPYTDSFMSAGDMEVYANMEEAVFNARPADATSAPTGSGRYSQGIPDEEEQYAVRLRIKNLDNMTFPVARIVSISKSGTTTANVVCNTPHGLTTSDFVQIYGVRDQAAASFPNLTAQTAVSAIISPTEFQVVIGTASTVTSAGGVVFKVQGSVLAPGISAVVAQSVSRTNGILTVIGNTNWSGLLPGEYVHLYGCDAGSLGLYDKAYLVLRTSTTTLELADPLGADFTSINCGGAIIKRTDVRLHYMRMAGFTRHAVELAGSRGATDLARAQTVNGTIAISSGTITTVTTCSTLTGGAAAEDAATTSNPLIVGGVVRTAAAPVTLIAGDAARLTFSGAAQAIVKPYAVGETDFQVPAPVGGIANTATAFQIAPAAGASLRNHITGMDLYSEALTNATDLRIREPDLTCSSQTIASNTLTVSATHNLAIGDAVVFTASTVTGITAGVTYYVLTVPAATTLTLSATRGGSTLAISGTAVTATFHKVLWMTRIPTTGIPHRNIPFPTPLRGSVNTILQLQTPTASGAGAVYAALQGYVSP